MSSARVVKKNCKDVVEGLVDKLEEAEQIVDDGDALGAFPLEGLCWVRLAPPPSRSGGGRTLSLIHI